VSGLQQTEGSMSPMVCLHFQPRACCGQSEKREECSACSQFNNLKLVDDDVIEEDLLILENTRQLLRTVGKHCRLMINIDETGDTN